MASATVELLLAVLNLEIHLLLLDLLEDFHTRTLYLKRRAPLQEVPFVLFVMANAMIAWGFQVTNLLLGGHWAALNNYIHF